MPTQLADDLSVFDRADAAPGSPHEQVVFCEDAHTGLRAIIGIHSTTLGPALGGTRCYPYASTGAALTDVLRLSRGMTYKAALAGVDLGGGKAVIIGDPARVKSLAALLAYGRFVDSLGGRYITAGDIGFGAEDLDVLGQETEHVVGRTVAAGGSGDSGPTTALGVFQGIRAAARFVWGRTSLDGRTVGVEGLGKVGSELTGLLVRDGARVLVSDIHTAAVDRVRAQFPDVIACPGVIDAELDVYAPCALGGTLDHTAAERITASIVCGGANNQLTTGEVGTILHERGVVWVPDYVANAGGLIQVAAERGNHDQRWVDERVQAIGTTVSEILQAAAGQRSGPGAVADRIAETRLNSALVGRD